MTEYQLLRHHGTWNEAVRAAGFTPDESNRRLEDAELLADWGELARKLGRVPTRHGYRRDGKFSPGVFDRHFGPWTTVPQRFRSFAEQRPEWADVLELLPEAPAPNTPSPSAAEDDEVAAPSRSFRNTKLEGRPTYGDPIDFRGLRHEPVNEQGVVFLFGMIARELGYLVEAVQAGFPDLEAKRQIMPGRWQRVRIEFEFESRNYRDHGHAHDGCDLIVCWRHNWTNCPANIEVVELSSVVTTLATED